MKQWKIMFVLLFIVISSCSDDNPTNNNNNNNVSFDTVKIGTQVWMKKNLDVDHYRNGDPIPNVTDQLKWTKLTTGAWCCYENEVYWNDIYGKLYNWFAVNDSRGLAPKGWHIPSYDEWKVLIDYLGGKYEASSKLKDTGTIYWKYPFEDATNESGFSALSGGLRYDDGNFSYLEYQGIWWSTTEYLGSKPYPAWGWMLVADTIGIYDIHPHKSHGLSIRCVKD
ncbi:MAG: fibrobacter succinogenes major paralogous domain-containing protein [bacterium]